MPGQSFIRPPVRSRTSFMMPRPCRFSSASDRRIWNQWGGMGAFTGIYLQVYTSGVKRSRWPMADGRWPMTDGRRRQLVSERRDRIDAHGAAGGNRAGGERRRQQHESHAGERQWIGWLDAV